MEDDMQREINSQVNFDTLMYEISEMRTDTTEALGQDRVELAEVTGALDNQVRRRNENQQEFESATNGLAAKTAECNLYYENYHRDTEQR